ncbi:MAG: leucyl aminopeptidase [Rickettsiales bacterium]|jgi:leucyl aminopeptidase|nr:leucyl aminopeptidase [Rickettsiales bacterium]
MKIIFKTKFENRGVLISIFSEEYFEKNRDFFSKNAPTFGANYDEKVIVAAGENIKIFVGVGKNTGTVKLEQLGWELLRYIKNLKFERATLQFNGVESAYADGGDGNDEKLFAMLRGMELSNYKFDKYIVEKSIKKLEEFPEELVLIVKDVEQMEKNYRDFSLVRDNVFFCRDLINEPSNVVNPDSYSKICKDLEKYGLEVEVFGEKAMEKLGMNLILSVGKGSTVESKLVVLKWKGLKETNFPIAFVGKGVTFDSGGISLKSATAMYDMKCDMSGSAVVVATMKLLAERKAKVNALGVIGLVENMPSGSATKPGDIVKSMSGQSVEILNTDAEGRLALADTLYYTIASYRPATVIDLATLTEAIGIALGQFKSGIFTNNDDLAEEIKVASNSTGEYSWRMPLEEVGNNYDKMLDSTVADVKNISGVKYAGAIVTAQFLQRFIAGHSKWAHIDLACTAFTERNKCFYVENGATGYGVRLIDSLIRNSYESNYSY